MNRREYCPIAASVEVLGDRWTPLILREVMVGASGFNEIHRGIPRISRTLLAQRLRELQRRGLMTHVASRPGRSGVYTLTAAGQALTPIVWSMGAWAAEWMFGDPERHARAPRPCSPATPGSRPPAPARNDHAPDGPE